MGKTAIDIIENQIIAAQDTIITVTVDHLIDNLGELSVIGNYLTVVQGPIRQKIEDEVGTEIEPELRAHTDAHIAYIEDAIEHGPDVVDQHESVLMDTNPLWTMLETNRETTEAVREKLLHHNRESATILASWVDRAEGETFASFVELADFLGKDGSEVSDTITSLLYYIDLLDAYRGHLNPGVYHRALAHNPVQSWFLDHLIDGLEAGREGVADHIATSIDRGERT